MHFAMKRASHIDCQPLCADDFRPTHALSAPFRQPIPYHGFRLHIRTLGYQQLRCDRLSTLTCRVQRRVTVLDPTQRQGKEVQQ